MAKATELTGLVPMGVTKVALTVDAEDDLLTDIVENTGIDMMQLHGSESFGRVAEVQKRFGLPVMKALAIGGAQDVIQSRTYEPVADYLMFDSKPPKNSTRPGGNAKAFDWGLIADETWSKPWFLAGGLSAENVVEAIRTSGAVGVDVSSGVEDAPGIKNFDKVHKFIDAVNSVEA